MWRVVQWYLECSGSIVLLLFLVRRWWQCVKVVVVRLLQVVVDFQWDLQVVRRLAVVVDLDRIVCVECLWRRWPWPCCHRRS